MKPNKYENLNFNSKTSISCSRVRVIKTRSETIKIMSNSLRFEQKLSSVIIVFVSQTEFLLVTFK